MGYKPRQSNAHRKYYALVEYHIKRNVFQARQWDANRHALEFNMSEEDGPITVTMIMHREDFERLEADGRAVDLCKRV